MRAVVIIPTYNEADNIQRFLTQVRQDAPNTDILVVDDNSPDGTAQLAESVASQLGSITVINRTGKRGYAAASREAMQSAIDSGYEVIATMDADFSHDPLVLEQLITQVANGSSLVIGSRYVADGKVTNWSLFRRVLSRGGNLYTAFCLRLKIKDCTSGFRASMRGEKNIVEVPIIFNDRKYGTSKMNARIIRESMVLVTRWGIALRTGIGRKHLPRS